MTKTKLVEINRFKAKSDAGKIFEVVEYENIITTEPINGSPTTLKGTKELRLSDGNSVNWLSDETFQIVQTDEIIRKL